VNLRQASSMLPFFAVPALSAFSPLLVIPSITHRYGATAWAAIAVAQSVGGALAIVAELGWGVVGPQRVAGLPVEPSRQVYRVSLISKLMVSLILAPLAAVLAHWLAPSFKLEAAVAAVGFCFGALSPAWYFIGRNQPWRILAGESIPKVAISISCALFIAGGAPFLLYSLLMVVSGVLPPLLSIPLVGRSSTSIGRWPEQVRDSIRAQAVVVVGRSVSIVYTALPIALVALLNPAIVPVFSAVERLMRMALSLLVGVPSRLQSWIGSAPVELRRERIRRSLQYNLWLGIFCGLGFALLADPVAQIVFAGEIPIPIGVTLLSGLLLTIVCCSRGLGLALVAVEDASYLTWSISASAAVGLGSILLFTPTLGLAGPIIGEILAEFTGLSMQGRRLWAVRNTSDVVVPESEPMTVTDSPTIGTGANRTFVKSRPENSAEIVTSRGIG
jgi:O-antigen/teichoic acid export membrane protein